MSSVLHHLDEPDYVQINVADYTTEQRATVRTAVADLGDPRVFIVGDS